MLKGVSVKIRNRINREHRLFPSQRRKSRVEIIGDPTWTAAVQRSLAQHEIYLSKFTWTSDTHFPYSEAWQLIRNDSRVNGTLYKIQKIFEDIPWSCRSLRQKPRETGRRSRKREWALRALNSLCGWPDEFLLDAPALCMKTYKIDQRVKWLLEALCSAHPGSYERNFLMAVAKDAGVWPPPDWWRVTRILLGDKRFLRNRK